MTRTKSHQGKVAALIKKKMSSADAGNQNDRLAPSNHAGRSNYPHSKTGERTVPEIIPLKPVEPGEFRLQKGAAVARRFVSLGSRREREKIPIDAPKRLNHAARAIQPSASILSTSVSGTSRRREIATDSILDRRMARRTDPSGERSFPNGSGGCLK